MQSNRYSEISFDGYTTVTYEGNKADQVGGAVFSNDNSNVTFDKDSAVMFSVNRAAAMSFSNYALVLFQGNVTVKFTK